MLWLDKVHCIINKQFNNIDGQQNWENWVIGSLLFYLFLFCFFFFSSSQWRAAITEEWTIFQTESSEEHLTSSQAPYQGLVGILNTVPSSVVNICPYTMNLCVKSYFFALVTKEQQSNMETLGLPDLLIVYYPKKPGKMWHS